MRLMKSMTTVLMVLTTTFIVACGKDSNRGDGSNGGSSDVVAFVPTPEACMRQPTTMNGWSSYQNYGFQQCNWSAYQNGYGQNGYGPQWPNNQYGYQNGYPAGYPNAYSQASCGCPSGFQPVCDGSLGGMVCMPVNNGWQYQNSMIYWGWNNQSQFGHYAGYRQGYWNNAYASPFGQSCWVGTNSCGYGICQPLQAGSNVGVCVR